MNKKLLVVAVAAALVAPLSAHAELKLSGTIQAEVGSLQLDGTGYDWGKDAVSGTGVFDPASNAHNPDFYYPFADAKAEADYNKAAKVNIGPTVNGVTTTTITGPNPIPLATSVTTVRPAVAGQKVVTQETVTTGYVTRVVNPSADRTTISSDGSGALAGGGPNKIRLDFDEKLSAGLTAFGRVDFGFNTAEDSGLSDREHFVGLKGSNVHFKFGRIEGAYKQTATGDIDPLYNTGIQARSFASGMSGGTPFAHSSFVDNVVELGFQTGGFSVVAQSTVDETAKEEGSLQLGIQYRTDNWGAFLAGAYHDFDLNKATSNLTGDDDSQGNVKAGGWYKTGGLKLGLQYEMAQEGTLAYRDYVTVTTTQTTDAYNNVNTTTSDPVYGRQWDEADYIMGSASYQMGNVVISGWVAGYMSDWENEDALSFSLAAIYAFSKRTIAYAGYHDTSSDNEARDWDVFAVGMRHSF
jgi:hypothetical protein